MNNKKKKKAKILKIALIAFFIYFVVSITIMQIDIAHRKGILETAQGELKQQKYLNKEIEDILNLGNNEEYILRMAREKLGLVFPGERVFIDIK
ncbi:MAG: septum formation initiator family protein [Oscillospiraceae bacterium]